MSNPFASHCRAAGIFALSVFAAANCARAADGAGSAERSESAWIALARGRVEPPGGIIQIAAGRDGVIKEILVNEGDRVEKDTTLAIMDDTAVQLALTVAKSEMAQAEAALVPPQLRKAAAKREIHRLEQLVAEKLANTQELDQARDNLALIEADLAQAVSAVETTRARVAAARHEVDLRVVRAPVAGLILRLLASPGEVLSTSSATPLFWLAPNGPRLVRAELDEEAEQHIAPGQLAEVLTEGSNPRTIKAKVLRVGLVFGPKRPSTDDPAERQDVRVVDCVLILDDTGPALLIGQRVVVRFLRARTAAP